MFDKSLELVSVVFNSDLSNKIVDELMLRLFNVSKCDEE